MENRKFPSIELLAIIAIILLILFTNKCDRKDDKTIITIPEYSKTTDTIYLNKVIEKKIYIKGKTVAVDGTSYINYEKETDTTKKKELFIDAITIRKYDTIIEDSDKIKIKLHAKTKGELLSVNADYTIKESKVEIPRPKVNLLLGGEVDTKAVFSLKPELQFRNGDMISTSINSDKSFSIGYSKRILSFK